MDTALHAGLRWLPLTGWPRPACPPLPARVAEITTLVREAGEPGADPLGGAAHALNKAALLASDYGLDDLARDLCWRHIDSYRQASRPLTLDLARRMLGPALNLAWLKLRSGEPDSALRLLEAIHHAVTVGSDLIIDGQVLPVVGLAGSPEEHARLRTIVRQHHASRAFHLNASSLVSTGASSAPRSACGAVLTGLRGSRSCQVLIAAQWPGPCASRRCCCGPGASAAAVPEPYAPSSRRRSCGIRVVVLRSSRIRL